MPSSSRVESARLALMAVQYKEQVGAELRRRRVALRLSQSQVADRVENWLRANRDRAPGETFDPQNVSRWERGANMATSGNLEAVAHALETTVAEIMGSIKPEGKKLTVLDGGKRSDDDLRQELRQVKEQLDWLTQQWSQELSPFLASQKIRAGGASVQGKTPKPGSARPKRGRRHSDS